MGLMDGAVNGLVSRLIPAGFLPTEAFCLAQAAYIREGKRAEGVPHAILGRKDATWEISQALNLLGTFPIGTEAHRQRIILWEKIFGRGSWPEPIDPSEIYGEVAQSGQPQKAVPKGHLPEQVLPNATRYFPPVETFDVGLETLVLPCVWHSENEEAYLVIEQDNYGLFESADIESDTIQGRSPILGKVEDLVGCTITFPEAVDISAPRATVNHTPSTGSEVPWVRRIVDDAGDILVTFETEDTVYVAQVRYGAEKFSPQYRAAIVDLLEAVLNRLTEHIEPTDMSGSHETL